MYNYFYNNVVDFNNAINSHWPENQNQVTTDTGSITTGNDDLSNLPPEILTEMMMYLPLESVQALSLTNHKIKPITEPIIKFKTNVLNQELLKVFNIQYVKSFRQFHRPLNEDFERAKTLKNGSDERVKVLSDAICSFIGEKTLETLLCPFSISGIFTNKPLLVQVMKSLIHGASSFKYNYDKINDKRYNHNKINIEMLFFHLLKTNQIHLEKLHFKIFNVTSVPGKLLEALIEALSENQSINKVSIYWENCDLMQLDSILEAIKNNERIIKFEIRDIGSKRNCCGNEWPWEKTTKEKSYKEFEDLIKNKLSLTFQISEKDNYGNFPCQRLPV